eukprot:g20549.t1
MGAHFRIPVISNLEWGVIPNYLSGSTQVHVADSSQGGADRYVPPPDLGAVGNRSWGQTEYQESDSEDEESVFPLSLPKVGARCYSQHWAREVTAIVIGGETYGLSLEALSLAEQTGGQRLYIPMVPGMDSLNSAMAASVLLFEGRRQLLAQ